MDNIRFALAQQSSAVADFGANACEVLRLWERAKEQGADIIVFPEMYLSGYPAEDLVLKPSFVRQGEEALRWIVSQIPSDGPDLVLGTIWPGERSLPYNALAHISCGKLEALRFKRCLPNTGVFDEQRVFLPGSVQEPILVRGIRVGTCICEDMWSEEVVRDISNSGAEALISINASPYWRDKAEERRRVTQRCWRKTQRPILYVNRVGAQDELVFDGQSFGLDSAGEEPFRLEAFEPSLAIVDWNRDQNSLRLKTHDTLHQPCEAIELDYRALVHGTRGYVEASGFSTVVLGLSGGIDSALVAAIAADALSPEQVTGIQLPYHFTAKNSLSDAQECGKLLGINYLVMPIEPAVESCVDVWSDSEPEPLSGLAMENLQSRLRGTLLMAHANSLGSLLLTTGNKSELAVGYSTLYGDMNGAFNPIKDVYKQKVYQLARYRNQERPAGCLGPGGSVIPEGILVKDPSAELAFDQRDSDILPPYQLLDQILHYLIEEDFSGDEICELGVDPTVVQFVETSLYKAEFKRRQAAPGPKITVRNLSKDWRYPLCHRFASARMPGLS